MKQKAFLSAGEAARALGVSVKTIQRWDQEHADNLARQSERLEQVAFERGYEVVALIDEQASSLNEKRKGFWRLLRLIEQQEIDVVLIEYPDRLVRFGFSFLEECFGWKGVRLEVVEPPQAQNVTEELTQDLLTIINAFSGRLYGQRAKHVRACMKACLQGARDGTSE